MSANSNKTFILYILVPRMVYAGVGALRGKQTASFASGNACIANYTKEQLNVLINSRGR